MDLSLIFEWLFVALVLLGLTYAALVIREEKEAYKDSASDVEFGPYLFFVPSWWGQEEEDGQLIFKRDDTNYEWRLVLKSLPYTEEHGPARVILEDYLAGEKIIFDDEVKQEETNESFFTSTKVRERIDDFIRIEGTATRDQEKRLYLDILFLRDFVSKELLMLISTSSILNGAVEGPYVEEVMKTFEVPETTL